MYLSSAVDDLVTIILFSPTATSFPDGKFTLNDLDRLEAASGISVYEQLAPEILPEMASTLQLDGPTPDNPKRLFEEWVLGKSALPPTWPTLVGVLLGVRHPLGSEIENFFNTQTPMTQAVSLVRMCNCYFCYTHLFFTLLLFNSQLVEKKKKKESPSSEKKSEGGNAIALRLAKGRHSYQSAQVL